MPSSGETAETLFCSDTDKTSTAYIHWLGDITLRKLYTSTFQFRFGRNSKKIDVPVDLRISVLWCHTELFLPSQAARGCWQLLDSLLVEQVPKFNSFSWHHVS